MRAFVLILAFIFAVLPVEGTGLPRRAMLGAAIGDGAPGARIEQVFAGSSAEAAGLKPGDVVVGIDGAPVDGPDDLLAMLAGRRAGEGVTLTVVGTGGKRVLAVTLLGAPQESAPDIDTIYGDVAVEGARRRTILTRPKGAARLPGVLFVGGIGCYPVDAPLNGEDSYRRLAGEITRAGFATMRVEKSGVGDSEGQPCMETDLDAEVAGYAAGLEALKARDDVDPERIFIVGHSIGGIVGPLVAKGAGVRGVVAIATVGSTWFEYELENSRRQLRLAGDGAEAIAAELLLKERCMHRLLIAREARAVILADEEACGGQLAYPASDAYLQQIAGLNFPALWTGLDAEALLVYGAADFVTSREEHLLLFDAVNAARPNRAEFVEIPDMDHNLTRVADQATSFGNNGSGTVAPFHEGLAEIVTRWLGARS